MNRLPHSRLPDPSGVNAVAQPPAALLARAADALALPLLLLSVDGRLLHANAAGHKLLVAATWLRLDEAGRVRTAPEPSAASARTPALTQALTHALAAAAAGTPQWLRAPGQALPGASLSVVRLPALRGGDAVTLLLTVTDPGTAADLSAFAQLHGLTPAETRVLVLLCQGRTQSEAAATLGVSLATLRSHAAALRRKTGHRRLTTLLQAVARLPPLAAAAPPRGAH
jgi:DNA-binding CsgD family transcriptional regulator